MLVAVYPAPIVNLGNDTTIASPNTVTLDAGTGVSYLWSTGATTQTIVVSTSGTYTVTVTDANGCEGSDVIVVNVLTALNEIVDGMIKNIYPQPATDVVNITFGNINMNGTLKFINSLGQVVVEKKVDATMSNRKSSIDVSQLPAGWYSISLTDNKQVFNYKILLQ
ncbi:MAG: T9SS type A sorting domain-containing protein [Bacteroidetes bacterium]|nr:T9SS type A sorting domain-containing protein [Bacteroidota bacterium]